MANGTWKPHGADEDEGEVSACGQGRLGTWSFCPKSGQMKSSGSVKFSQELLFEKFVGFCCWVYQGRVALCSDLVNDVLQAPWHSMSFVARRLCSAMSLSAAPGTNESDAESMAPREANALRCAATPLGRGRLGAARVVGRDRKRRRSSETALVRQGSGNFVESHRHMRGFSPHVVVHRSSLTSTFEIP